MQRLTVRLTYANVVSTVCLFILLGGGAYAATQLPKGSVGSAQIKRGAVTSSKVKNSSLRAVDFKEGQLPPGPQGATGPRGFAGVPGGAAAPTFAHVASDGTLDQARTEGIFQAVKRVAPGSGTYCLRVTTATSYNPATPRSQTYSAPRSVTVTPESADTAVAVTLDSALIPPDCG